MAWLRRAAKRASRQRLRHRYEQLFFLLRPDDQDEDNARQTAGLRHAQRHRRIWGWKTCGSCSTLAAERMAGIAMRSQPLLRQQMGNLTAMIGLMMNIDSMSCAYCKRFDPVTLRFRFVCSQTRQTMLRTL